MFDHFEVELEPTDGGAILYADAHGEHTATPLSTDHLRQIRDWINAVLPDG